MPLHVSVITPEKEIFTREADFIAAPAVDGEVGILPGHTPYLTQLGHGELRLKKGTEVEYLALSGGFLEVQENNRVDVFAETAAMADEIDEEQERLLAERAKAQMVEAKDLTPEEMAKVEVSLVRSLMKLKVAKLRSRKKPPH